MDVFGLSTHTHQENIQTPLHKYISDDDLTHREKTKPRCTKRYLLFIIIGGCDKLNGGLMGWGNL